MEDPLLWQLLLQAVLILLNATFACAEIAVITMNDNRLAQMAKQGDRRAIRLARLTSQPAKFLATIQVAITLSGFLGSAFAADNFSDRIVAGLIGAGCAIPQKTLNTISVVLITMLLSYFTLVFGELVPKRVAMKNAEALALGMSGAIAFIARLFAPLVWLLTASTNGILRLVGIDPNAEDNQMSEEEIRMMVDVGSQKGVIDQEEKEIIQNVFEFDDTAVGEFATHRTDIALLWMDETADEWEKTIHDSRHSFYPVCDETIDNVVGVLSAKDYFRLSSRVRRNVMKEAVRPVYFVPETVRADVLFKQMKKTHNHFAVVLDEYGGMTGIVTMNDLLEQLVGDLEDEIAPEDMQLPVEQLDSSTWLIRGDATLDEVSEKLGVALPVDEYDTFSGFVFGCHGTIPDDGAVFELDSCGLHIKVTEIRDHMVEKAIVCREAPPEREPAE